MQLRLGLAATPPARSPSQNVGGLKQWKTMLCIKRATNYAYIISPAPRAHVLACLPGLPGLSVCASLCPSLRLFLRLGWARA